MARLEVKLTKSTVDGERVWGNVRWSIRNAWLQSWVYVPASAETVYLMFDQEFPSEFGRSKWEVPIEEQPFGCFYSPSGRIFVWLPRQELYDMFLAHWQLDEWLSYRFIREFWFWVEYEVA